MGFRSWMQSHKNDEREQAYIFRAGSAAYSVVSIGTLLLAFVYLLQGRINEAVAISAIVSLSQVVFWVLLKRWRVGQ